MSILHIISRVVLSVTNGFSFMIQWTWVTYTTIVKLKYLCLSFETIITTGLRWPEFTFSNRQIWFPSNMYSLSYFWPLISICSRDLSFSFIQSSSLSSNILPSSFVVFPVFLYYGGNIFDHIPPFKYLWSFSNHHSLRIFDFLHPPTNSSRILPINDVISAHFHLLTNTETPTKISWKTYWQRK